MRSKAPTSGPVLVGFALALALTACSAAQVQQAAQTVDTDVGSLAQGVLAAVDAACADAAPVIAAASAAAPASATVASLAAYGNAVCAPDGEVVPSVTIDPSTAGWIGGIKAGLQIAANLPATAAAAATPTPASAASSPQ